LLDKIPDFKALRTYYNTKEKPFKRAN